MTTCFCKTGIGQKQNEVKYHTHWHRPWQTISNINYNNYLDSFDNHKNGTQLSQVSQGTIPIPKDMLFITNCSALPVGILNFLHLFVCVIVSMVLTSPKVSGKTLSLHVYAGAQSFFPMTFSALIIQNIKQASV